MAEGHAAGSERCANISGLAPWPNETGELIRPPVHGGRTDRPARAPHANPLNPRHISFKKAAMTPATKAYFVHLFTATGAIFAMLALLAAAQGDWALMFIWLVVALIVDGIDGEPNGASQVGGFAPTVSGNGAIAAFASGASNLVDGDGNGVVSTEEFVAMGEDWFARFDPDGDGAVTLEDFGPGRR